MNRKISLTIVIGVALATCLGGCGWPERDQRLVWTDVTQYEHRKKNEMRGYNFPDPETVRGILIYDDSDLTTATIEMLIGDCAEIERLLGKQLKPKRNVPDGQLVKEIATFYKQALDKGREKNFWQASVQYARIVFVTLGDVQIRSFEFDDTEKTIYDSWMESKELWPIFYKLNQVGEHAIEHD